MLLRIDRMVSRLNPLFIDVTWGAGGSTQNKSFVVASHVQRYCGVDVLLHLTCTEMTRDRMAAILSQCKYCGIQNILVLRGDPARGLEKWTPMEGGFEYAIELVRYIRELHGDYFCIAVAGHPEGHSSSNSVDEDLVYLKEKVDFGADYIITQFFYDTDAFITYVRKCRESGITCPIIPGIMPIQSFSSFIRMTDFCGISVPKGVLDLLLPVKDDDDAVKEIGCSIAADMCSKILKARLPGVDGVHFYTLNLERSVTKILHSMRAVEPMPNAPSSGESDGEDSFLMSRQRQLPWRPSQMEKRAKEEIRPINWANRPKSYVARTEDWDEYPNGRWGDASSPAFGELSGLVHFYNFSLGSEDARREMLKGGADGESPPSTPSDIYEVFARYIEGKVPHLPWSESSLQPESFTIQAELAELNRRGFLTINSQPAVNGDPSDNPQFGWGGPGGYVYQKAYCECFVSPENAQKLVRMASQNQSMNLYAVNSAGEQLQMGVDESGVTAVTWGEF